MMKSPDFHQDSKRNVNIRVFIPFKQIFLKNLVTNFILSPINLLKAYAEIAQPTDRLIIAGKSYDEAYFASIKQRADTIPSVSIYHRFIEDDEVQVFFNAADVIVLPFVRIDHSGSVDLAMSFSKPVITLKTEAMMKLLRHQSELLFEKPEKLTTCLKNAKEINAQVIGQQNFNVADSTNYRDILHLFEL